MLKRSHVQFSVLQLQRLYDLLASAFCKFDVHMLFVKCVLGIVLCQLRKFEHIFDQPHKHMRFHERSVGSSTRNCLFMA